MTTIQLVAAVLLVVGSTLLLRALVAADVALDRTEAARAPRQRSETTPRLGRAA